MQQIDTRSPGGSLFTVRNSGSAFMASPEVRVILIEDSPIIRERLLEALGQIANISVVAQAETEWEATALLRNSAWDVAILDLQLKEGSGLGVLKQLPRQRRPEASKIIVFTNFGFPQYRQRCMALGADYFFDKSREFESMREVLVTLSQEALSPRH
jgi:two-component system OmpR family response regulator